MTPAEIVKALTARGETLGCAESLTGGLLCDAIVQVPGASRVFMGGIVAYDEGRKASLLGVQPQTLARHTAVSAETATEMAAGAKRVSGADVAVAVTGVAGPGCSENKPVGLVYIAVADRDGVRAERFETGRKDREFNRYVTASRALHMVWQSIQKY